MTPLPNLQAPERPFPKGSLRGQRWEIWQQIPDSTPNNSPTRHDCPAGILFEKVLKTLQCG